MKRLMDECLEIPACPTGHWPFGAAAQKGITGMISAAAAAWVTAAQEMTALAQQAALQWEREPNKRPLYLP